MGRPPCCDKSGVKKGPWTPEEDIMLVSYVQEHGPGNWRAVPTNTGLCRCSKSCRLRWTNYLRPGIKRGSFTDHEEKMIIQLQALLGNKWAAIASYLPERTDNDIKNYWNTHLKKKLKKLQTRAGNGLSSSSSSSLSTMGRGQWEKRLQTDINMAKQALHEALSSSNFDSSPTSISPNPFVKQPPIINQPSTYASSTENIAKLLKNWTKSNKKQPETDSSSTTQYSFNNYSTSSAHHGATKNNITNVGGGSGGVDLSEAFESLFGFDSIETSNSNFSGSMSPEEASLFQGESKPFSLMLENWFFDHEATTTITTHGIKEEGLTNFSSFDENADLFN